MYGSYAKDVEFYVVYIQEAHPSDGWQVAINEAEEVIFEQPRSLDDREAVAEACVLHLNLSIPTLLDEMENEVDHLYGALPDRLYLIDEEGRVAFRSGPGPWGFKPEELEAAIETYLGQGAR
jgi:hypothetical protein